MMLWIKVRRMTNPSRPASGVVEVPVTTFWHDTERDQDNRDRDQTDEKGEKQTAAYRDKYLMKHRYLLPVSRIVHWWKTRPGQT